MRAGPRPVICLAAPDSCPDLHPRAVIGSVRAARRLLRWRVGGAEPHPGNRSHESRRRRRSVARPACAAPARTQPRPVVRQAPIPLAAGRHAVAGGPRVGAPGHAGRRHRRRGAGAAAAHQGLRRQQRDLEEPGLLQRGEDGAGQVRRRRCPAARPAELAAAGQAEAGTVAADQDAWRGPVRGDRGHQPQAHQAGGVAAAVAAADAVLSRERARLHDQRDAAGLPREAGAGRRQAAGALHAADARLRHHLHRLLLDAGHRHPAQGWHRRPGADVGVPR